MAGGDYGYGPSTARARPRTDWRRRGEGGRGGREGGETEGEERRRRERRTREWIKLAGSHIWNGQELVEASRSGPLCSGTLRGAGGHRRRRRGRRRLRGDSTLAGSPLKQEQIKTAAGAAAASRQRQHQLPCQNQRQGAKASERRPCPDDGRKASLKKLGRPQNSKSMLWTTGMLSPASVSLAGGPASGVDTGAAHQGAAR